MSLPQQSSLPFGKATMNLKEAKELPIYLTLKEVAELLKYDLRLGKRQQNSIRA
jgi:hypothetical protein